jgi:hypothetical protein
VTEEFGEGGGAEEEWSHFELSSAFEGDEGVSVDLKLFCRCTRKCRCWPSRNLGSAEAEMSWMISVQTPVEVSRLSTPQ